MSYHQKRKLRRPLFNSMGKPIENPGSHDSPINDNGDFSYDSQLFDFDQVDITRAPSSENETHMSLDNRVGNVLESCEFERKSINSHIEHGSSVEVETVNRPVRAMFRKRIAIHEKEDMIDWQRLVERKKKEISMVPEGISKSIIEVCSVASIVLPDARIAIRTNSEPEYEYKIEIMNHINENGLKRIIKGFTIAVANNFYSAIARQFESCTIPNLIPIDKALSPSKLCITGPVFSFEKLLNLFELTCCELKSNISHARTAVNNLQTRLHGCRLRNAYNEAHEAYIELRESRINYSHLFVSQLYNVLEILCSIPMLINILSDSRSSYFQFIIPQLQSIGRALTSLPWKKYLPPETTLITQKLQIENQLTAILERTENYRKAIATIESEIATINSEPPVDETESIAAMNSRIDAIDIEISDLEDRMKTLKEERLRLAFARDRTLQLADKTRIGRAEAMRELENQLVQNRHACELLIKNASEHETIIQTFTDALAIYTSDEILNTINESLMPSCDLMVELKNLHHALIDNLSRELAAIAGSLSTSLNVDNNKSIFECFASIGSRIDAIYKSMAAKETLLSQLESLDSKTSCDSSNQNNDDNDEESIISAAEIQVKIAKLEEVDDLAELSNILNLLEVQALPISNMVKQREAYDHGKINAIEKHAPFMFNCFIDKTPLQRML